MACDPKLGARVHMVLANAGREPVNTMQVTNLVGLHGGFACNQVWRVLDRLARNGHAERMFWMRGRYQFWRATPGGTDGGDRG